MSASELVVKTDATDIADSSYDFHQCIHCQLLSFSVSSSSLVHKKSPRINTNCYATSMLWYLAIELLASSARANEDVK